MKLEHRSIIQRAKKEELSPAELASELLGHYLLTVMLSVLRGHAVAFRNLTEMQQDAAIKEMEDALRPAVLMAVGVISTRGAKSVRMTLKKATIGKQWQFTGVVDPKEDNVHELGNKAQDQSDVLVVLAEDDYFQGLDGVQSDKDQKTLPLDSDEAGASSKAGTKKDKPVKIPARQLEQAREFVVIQQNTTLAAMQNYLKVDVTRARAIFVELEGLGVVTAPDDQGQRKLVRTEVAGLPEDDGGEPEEKISVDAPALEDLTDELYGEIRDSVVARQSVGAGVIMVDHAVSEDVALQAIAKLEADGVISAESDMGGREVLVLS